MSISHNTNVQLEWKRKHAILRDMHRDLWRKLHDYDNEVREINVEDTGSLALAKEKYHSLSLEIDGMRDVLCQIENLTSTAEITEALSMKSANKKTSTESARLLSNFGVIGNRIQSLYIAKISRPPAADNAAVSFKKGHPNQNQCYVSVQQTDQVQAERTAHTESEMRQLASDIETVQHLYVQLNRIINEQTDMVDSIAANADTAYEQNKQANVQLVSAVKSAKSARKKKIILCIVIAVVVLLVVIVVGTTLKLV